MNLETCLEIEKQIIEKTVHTLIDLGYFLSVWDGEDFAIIQSSDAEGVIAAMAQTEEESLHVLKAEGKRAGVVYFVYGNDGWDVICDYSTALEKTLEPVFTLANKLEKQYG